MKPKIVILGAGLSGLLLAYRLKKLGFTLLILEARTRIGGRISTLQPHDTPIEMGATWFGKQHTYLIALLEELQLDHFEQYMTGTAFFEPFSTAPPQLVQIPQDSPSYRIQRGTSSIIQLLALDLTADELVLDQPVSAIHFEKEQVVIQSADRYWEADLVISTLPPALLVNTIQCHPKLPDQLTQLAQATHTWMQDSIKTALVYRTPFWKNRNLSGTIFSNVGPINEFYDHSDVSNTHFALCGFVSGSMSQLTPELRKEKVVQQLVKMFGDEAAEFLSYEEVIWSAEPYTKNSQPNEVEPYPHQNNGHPLYSQPFFQQRLWLAGTETAAVYPGYMEGAVVAAQRVIGEMERLFP
jgi:monoamine oxidase